MVQVQTTGARDSSREAAIDRMMARDQIREVVSRYSHGIDRCDVASLKTVFWPDGTCDYGNFAGNAWEFADMVVEALGGLEGTQHFIGNIMIELDGENRATGETYVIAYHDMTDEDGSRVIRVVGGRYVDRFEKRDEEWRIADRLYLMDWNQNDPTTQDWDGWIYGALNKGCRAPDDKASGWLLSGLNR